MLNSGCGIFEIDDGQHSWQRCDIGENVRLMSALASNVPQLINRTIPQREKLRERQVEQETIKTETLVERKDRSPADSKLPERLMFGILLQRLKAAGST